MANEESFVDATCHIINPERMEDRDFVTRFVAFYLQDYTTYEPDMDSFMTKGMALIKKLTPAGRQQMKDDFVKAMKAAIDIFGNDAFRKRKSVDDRRRPINKALFEALSVWMARCSDADIKELIKKKEIVRDLFIELNNDDKFFYALSSGTGQKDSVNYRHRKIQDLIATALIS